ncbi:TPA: cadmium resistance transporter [Streptococcus suis]
MYLGQLLGSFILILASFTLSQFANLLPSEWMIGLLGIFPIFLGVRILFESEEDVQISDKTIEVLSVLLLSLASGADNLGIFSPYFTTLTMPEFIVTAVIILLGTTVICFIADAFGSLSHISEFVEKYERIILPLVFILLGVYILIEFGTLNYLLAFFH